MKSFIIIVFSQIRVTLRIENTVSNPIPASFITTLKTGRCWSTFLNKAAKENKQGPFNRYESTYFGGLGYFITAINGTKQDLATSTFWLIFDDQSGGAYSVWREILCACRQFHHHLPLHSILAFLRSWQRCKRILQTISISSPGSSSTS